MKMERIILIETSTALCSVALAENGAVTSYRESSAPKAHASLTAVFIREVLAERGISLTDCDAVCVSMGPGSYTGLRVGVSTAKGLCFGSGKPLLAVGTLDTLVAQAQMGGHDGTELTGHDGNDQHVIARSAANQHVIERSEEMCQSTQYSYIIPMIDARRMEVYAAVFKAATAPEDSSNNIEQATATAAPAFVQITETAPAIIDENSLAEYLEEGPCLFIGDGAGKCADVLKHPNAHFCQCHPKASAMLEPALDALHKGDFKDVAYFEPFYLKEFVATVSKKKLF